MFASPEIGCHSDDRAQIRQHMTPQYATRHAGSIYAQLSLLTNLDCAAEPGTCLRENGSGWIVVGDAEVTDGTADHCYMGNIPEDSTEGGCQVAMDPVWLGSAIWGLEKGAEFLRAAIDP